MYYNVYYYNYNNYINYFPKSVILKRTLDWSLKSWGQFWLLQNQSDEEEAFHLTAYMSALVK